MNKQTNKTYWEKIYLSGNVDQIKNACQKFCYSNKLCVTVEKCDFIYTGGAEVGAVIGLINYPKYPLTEQTISEITLKLAEFLREFTNQDSVLIQNPYFTTWLSRRSDVTVG